MRTNRHVPGGPPVRLPSRGAPLPRTLQLLTVLLGVLLLVAPAGASADGLPGTGARAGGDGGTQGAGWAGDAAGTNEGAARTDGSARQADEPGRTTGSAREADEPGGPVPVIGRNWPVGTRPAVVRGWEPPATPYGAGHRGVDLAAADGTPVRAVAAGRVSFAGRVAGRGVVSVELTGTDLRTTYEPVIASVRAGDEVAAGEVVGSVEATGAHCGGVCLHWGLRRGESYLDPLSLLPPWLLHQAPPRLLPVLDVPLPHGRHP